MMQSNAQAGRYDFSQSTDAGTIHISFSIIEAGQSSRPVNMQLSIQSANQMMAGVQESLRRHSERLQQRIVAMDDTLKDTLNKDAVSKAAMLAALQLVVDTESGWMSEKCRELVTTALEKATGNA